MKLAEQTPLRSMVVMRMVMMMTMMIMMMTMMVMMMTMRMVMMTMTMSLSGLAVAQLVKEAGFPPGVVNVVPGFVFPSLSSSSSLPS